MPYSLGLSFHSYQMWKVQLTHEGLGEFHEKVGGKCLMGQRCLVSICQPELSLQLAGPRFPPLYNGQVEMTSKGPSCCQSSASSSCPSVVGPGGRRFLPFHWGAAFLLHPGLLDPHGLAMHLREIVLAFLLCEFSRTLGGSGITSLHVPQG